MHESALNELREALGPDGLVAGPAIDERYLRDINGQMGERPLALARPRDTAGVAQVLRVCNAAGIPVVPQGGQTGLVLSCRTSSNELLLSTDRMNAIESVDPDGGTALVQAGVVLQVLQEHLEPQGLSFPLDLGARGSCTIGGNIATNAGGNRVIRYGMTRDLVLGLEVVLADGTVLDGLRPYIKNNTGVDLKQLFIGTEGVLGVITRAVLRLVPLPAQVLVAFCALPDFDHVRALLRHLRARLGGNLTAFEVLWQDYYTRYLTLRHSRPPLPDAHDFYVLVEASGSAQDDLQSLLEDALGEAMEQDIIDNVVVAKSAGESEDIWHMRDSAVDVARTTGSHSSFDVSLRIAEMAAFADELEGVVQGISPDAQVVIFGHAGDGNLHLIIGWGKAGKAIKKPLETAVYELVRRYAGSVSAEHGIGVARLPYLGHTRSAAEIRTMQTLKHALDPNGILMPGRVLAREAGSGPA